MPLEGCIRICREALMEFMARPRDHWGTRMSEKHFSEIERIGDWRLMRHNASGGYYVAWRAHKPLLEPPPAVTAMLERAVSVDRAAARGGRDAD